MAKTSMIDKENKRRVLAAKGKYPAVAGCIIGAVYVEDRGAFTVILAFAVVASARWLTVGYFRASPNLVGRRIYQCRLQIQFQICLYV